MKNNFDIPLDRRIWTLTRMEELREQLSIEERESLLLKLKSITWSEWNEWFIVNLKIVVDYLNATQKNRKKQKTQLKDFLLVHHAAMFLVGLLYMAKNESFPSELINRDYQYSYDLSALSASIRAWDNIEGHCDNSLHWQFYEPYIDDSLLPFKKDEVNN